MGAPVILLLKMFYCCLRLDNLLAEVFNLFDSISWSFHGFYLPLLLSFPDRLDYVPHKYSPTIHKADITENDCLKVKKVGDLDYFWASNKYERFYGENLR